MQFVQKEYQVLKEELAQLASPISAVQGVVFMQRGSTLTKIAPMFTWTGAVSTQKD